jgi:hypothetical protein
MRDAITKLWRRPLADWVLLFRVAVVTITVRASLSVFPIRTVRNGLRAMAGHWRSRSPASSPYRRRAAWAANAIGHRFLPKRPCLTQALVLQYLLLQRGDDSSTLRIGVAKDDDGNLTAHAWVEWKGRVLIGGTASPTQYCQLQGLSEKLME